MNLRKMLCSGIIGCSLLAGTGFAADVYVKVPKADVLSGKSYSSSVLATVPKGTRLTVVSKSGVRYAVKLPNGKTGYISRLKVSDKAPDSGGGLGGLGGFKDDRGPSERRTAMSGRGLSEAAKKMAGSKGRHPNAVQWTERMEQLGKSISNAEVDAFRKAGGLR